MEREVARGTRKEKPKPNQHGKQGKEGGVDWEREEKEDGIRNRVERQKKKRKKTVISITGRC